MAQVINSTNGKVDKNGTLLLLGFRVVVGVWNEDLGLEIRA